MLMEKKRFQIKTLVHNTENDHEKVVLNVKYNFFLNLAFRQVGEKNEGKDY
jgi:hypothetical protein